MELTKVGYFKLPRDEDRRVPKSKLRPFTMALRWDHPAGQARTTLRQLSLGDTVSSEHMTGAMMGLAEAIAYYASGPIEPYPGRNEEARADLVDLRAELEEGLHPYKSEDASNFVTGEQFAESIRKAKECDIVFGIHKHEETER